MAMKLGKGLDDILGIEEEASAEFENIEEKGEFINIQIREIKASSQQPRKVFDEEALMELSQSIRRHGILQPLVARKIEDGYELIVGERRLRASEMAGLKSVPVRIIEVNDEASLILGLVENVQRANLSPLEEAESYDKLSKEFNLSHEAIAEKVGKSRSTITNLLRLLQATPQILDALGRNLITNGHARALLALKNKKRISEIIDSIVDEQLSVRETERIVRQINKGKKQKKEEGLEAKDKDLWYSEILENLEQQLGTKVSFNGTLNKGKVSLEYRTKKQLDELLSILERK